MSRIYFAYIKKTCINCLRTKYMTVKLILVDICHVCMCVCLCMCTKYQVRLRYGNRRRGECCRVLRLSFFLCAIVRSKSSFTKTILYSTVLRPEVPLISLLQQ